MNTETLEKLIEYAAESAMDASTLEGFREYVDAYVKLANLWLDLESEIEIEIGHESESDEDED